MIQRQQVCMPCDNVFGFAATRFLQPIHESGEQCPLRLLSPDPGEDNGRCADTYCGIHEILLSGTVQADQFHRFMMTTSRYSLGTTIVPSSALFMRPMRS